MFSSFKRSNTSRCSFAAHAGNTISAMRFEMQYNISSVRTLPNLRISSKLYSGLPFKSKNRSFLKTCCVLGTASWSMAFSAIANRSIFGQSRAICSRLVHFCKLQHRKLMHFSWRKFGSRTAMSDSLGNCRRFRLKITKMLVEWKKIALNMNCFN